MPGEFEGDLTEAVFWGADMSGARFRDVNFTGARISHAWVVDVDIDAFVDKLVVNGVDVTDYVNERDEWYPVRAMIRASDPDGLRAAWAALEEVWAPTIARAQGLGEEKAQESVNEEFSFVQTVRHLVFAMEKWFNVPILDESFHAMGLPNTGSLDFGWPGLDYSVKPSLAEALAVRAADRLDRDPLGREIAPEPPRDPFQNNLVAAAFDGDHHRWASGTQRSNYVDCSSTARSRCA